MDARRAIKPNLNSTCYHWNMHAKLTMNVNTHYLMNLLVMFYLIVQQQARLKGLLHPNQLAVQLRHLLPPQQNFLPVTQPTILPVIRPKVLPVIRPDFRPPTQLSNLPGIRPNFRPPTQLRNLLLLQHTNQQQALFPSLRQSVQLYMDRVHTKYAVQDLL